MAVRSSDISHTLWQLMFLTSQYCMSVSILLITLLISNIYRYLNYITDYLIVNLNYIFILSVLIYFYCDYHITTLKIHANIALRVHDYHNPINTVKPRNCNYSFRALLSTFVSAANTVVTIENIITRARTMVKSIFVFINDPLSYFHEGSFIRFAKAWALASLTFSVRHYLMKKTLTLNFAIPCGFHLRRGFLHCVRAFGFG